MNMGSDGTPKGGDSPQNLGSDPISGTDPISNPKTLLGDPKNRWIHPKTKLGDPKIQLGDPIKSWVTPRMNMGSDGTPKGGDSPQNRGSDPHIWDWPYK